MLDRTENPFRASPTPKLMFFIIQKRHLCDTHTRRINAHSVSVVKNWSLYATASYEFIYCNWTFQRDLWVRSKYSESRERCREASVQAKVERSGHTEFSSACVGFLLVHCRAERMPSELPLLSLNYEVQLYLTYRIPVGLSWSKWFPNSPPPSIYCQHHRAAFSWVYINEVKSGRCVSYTE